ncbi:hypothetical protein K491DRAFT_689516 [Lophiostoma macrostomum CBS 122681]|uniref:Uncharacterized protein n=1 Tax=Lophiostoma macrostomum CBS 122681 TaxID=1314788 RepID=A0A6A6TII3_9PLEO|nr:hypothetical protein K491DRAFT_689516 [Lophiostoma macrostomum CBS 122681]
MTVNAKGDTGNTRREPYVRYRKLILRKIHHMAVSQVRPGPERIPGESDAATARILRDYMAVRISVYELFTRCSQTHEITQINTSPGMLNFSPSRDNATSLVRLAKGQWTMLVTFNAPTRLLRARDTNCRGFISTCHLLSMHTVGSCGCVQPGRK